MMVHRIDDPQVYIYLIFILRYFILINLVNILLYIKI